jgi:hypothetical protein
MLALLATACGGGGDSGGGGSDEQQAGAAANKDIKTFLGLFDGSTNSQQLLNAFAPECRSGVSTSDIDKVAALIKAFAPDLSKAKVEDVDLGALTYETTSDGIKVTAKDPNATRIKTKGKWMSADDYFKLAGLDSSDTNVTSGEPTLMVKRNGAWYIGDCSILSDLSLN